MRRRVLVTALLVAQMAHAGNPPAQGQPVDQLAGLRMAWSQLLEKQDIEGSLALFTPDAVFLSPEGGRFDDRAAIRTLYRNIIATYQSHIDLVSSKLECAGTLCVDEGRYAESMTEKASGKLVQLRGSYLLVARRQNEGGWKIAEMAWTGGIGGPR